MVPKPNPRLGLHSLRHDFDMALDVYISQMIIPDGVYRNWNSYQHKVSGVNGPSFITLCDPQTSGGLLVAVDPDPPGLLEPKAES